MPKGIADTPGHEQYTRNMATGASTADLAIILIDARKGILTQSRRHAYIASLLGIRHLVAAINKMDLVDFSEDVYRTIENDFRELVASFGNASLITIPVSALDGDNVVEPSQRMPWYSGPTLLQHLEEVPVWTEEKNLGFRLPVQRVIRPDQYYRGFAGQISSGTVRVGDSIVALPSGRTSRISAITTFDGDIEQASAPQSIALTLEDELDISRGDVISEVARPPQHATSIEASLVWFDGHRLETHRPYLIKHGTQTISARVTRVTHRTNIQTLQQEAVNSLGMNDIGVVEIETVRPIFFDPYADNRASGNFILIDVKTNATAAAGMIRRSVATPTTAVAPTFKAALLAIADATQAGMVEQQLLASGCAVVRTRVQSEQLWRALLSIGVIVILEDSAAQHAKTALESSPAGPLLLEALDRNGLSSDSDAVSGFIQHLRHQGILPAQQESL